jgi:stalled ribosome rescue protein Dom34
MSSPAATPLFHAVAWVDHEQAQILQFDAEHLQASKVKAHHHNTRRHQSQVRTEHEYFGSVCDALQGISEVLVVGPKMALADFRHYVEKHRPHTLPLIAGWEVSEHQTEAQLVAMARRFFLKYDAFAADPASR